MYRYCTHGTVASTRVLIIGTMNTAHLVPNAVHEQVLVWPWDPTDGCTTGGLLDLSISIVFEELRALALNQRMKGERGGGERGWETLPHLMNSTLVHTSLLSLVCAQTSDFLKTIVFEEFRALALNQRKGAEEAHALTW